MYNLSVNPYKLNVNFKGDIHNEDVTLNEKITKSVKKLHDRSEREVPEYDYFKPVQVTFKNPNEALYVGDVTLKISQPPKESSPEYKKHRYLEATVYSPTRGQKFSRVLSNGNKKEILEKLKDKNFTQELEEFVNEASGMLIDDSY